MAVTRPWRKEEKEFHYILQVSVECIDPSNLVHTISLGSAAGCVPVELAKLNNLTKLHMRNNKLSGTLPVEIKNLPRLREIYLEGNDVSGG